jgi:predicted permease
MPISTTGINWGTLVFSLIYIVCVIAIIIYLIRLAVRFVRAHERGAVALESIAEKMRRDGPADR